MIQTKDSRILHNRHTGEELALRLVARDGQIWLELRGSLPPHREGLPLHVYYGETEEGQVVAGTLSAVVDGRRIQLRAGERGTFPAGSVHRWWNDGDDAYFELKVSDGFLAVQMTNAIPGRCGATITCQSAFFQKQ